MIKDSIRDHTWTNKEPFVYPDNENWRTQERPTFQVLEGNHRITALKQLCDEFKSKAKQNWVTYFFLFLKVLISNYVLESNHHECGNLQVVLNAEIAFC